MTTFAHHSLLDSRYAAIAETSVYTYDDDLVNYAEFLKKHERYMTKGGYLDSNRRVRSLERQQNDSNVPQNQNSSLRNSLPASINKSSSTPTLKPSKKSKQPSEIELPSIISVSTNIEHNQKEYDRQLRLIEGQVIKSKENELELKRSERDVKREQRPLHYTLKELDIDGPKKRFDAERFQSKNPDEKELSKKKDQQNKQRPDHVVDLIQTGKDADRENVLVCNDLARQYRIKANDIETKHQKLAEIHSEFENKRLEKAAEENRVKKEVGDIVMALHLESQKGKNDKSEYSNLLSRERIDTIKHDLRQEETFEERLNKTRVYVKNYGLERQHLFADATAQRAIIDVKQREAARRIIDTKNRLEKIYAKQRALNEDAAIAQQDRRAAELMTKIADVDNRRTQLASQYLREKIEREVAFETEGAAKAKVQYAEQETRQHEDHLRHFQKTASKNEEAEHDLQESLKQVEYERRKKEIEVKQIREELNRKKKLDAINVRKEISRAEHEEKELEEQIIKEKAELDKLHSRREDSYLRLIKHRDQIRDNRILLETHQREYERLLRVHARSQSLQSLNNI
ncbi:unnamed protein product [Adineta steineri]|uniref:Uncharacterized protein n=1 Tax=Adineta steineri TaxID=433720 RepID=A0A818RTV4_9BILA|nr:unnamed protein product [Adineta steineri]CAF3656403.1 unnamed protein product [Adineta steineri]